MSDVDLIVFASLQHIHDDNYLAEALDAIAESEGTDPANSERCRHHRDYVLVSRWYELPTKVPSQVRGMVWRETGTNSARTIALELTTGEKGPRLVGRAGHWKSPTGKRTPDGARYHPSTHRGKYVEGNQKVIVGASWMAKMRLLVEDALARSQPLNQLEVVK